MGYSPIRHIFKSLLTVLLPLMLVSNFSLHVITRNVVQIVPRQDKFFGEALVIRFLPWELVTAISWSPDGDYIAVAAGNNIHLYNAISQQHIIELSLSALTTGLSFSPAGGQLAAGSRDGYLRAWKMADINNKNGNSQVLPMWQSFAHKKGVNSLGYNQTGSWIASGGNDGMTRVWNAVDGKSVTAMIGGSFAVSSVAISPSGKILAIANGNMIRLRDIASGRIIGSFRTDNSLSSLAFHPNGTLLASGDSNNKVELWLPESAFKTGSLDYPRPIQLGAHKGEVGTISALVWQVSFSPNGEQIASAGGDGRIYLWDVKSQSLIQTLIGHQKAVTSLSFNPDGSSLASGSLDGTVRIWSLGK